MRIWEESLEYAKIPKVTQPKFKACPSGFRVGYVKPPPAPLKCQNDYSKRSCKGRKEMDLFTKNILSLKSSKEFKKLKYELLNYSLYYWIHALSIKKFTTLNQQNAQYISLDIHIKISHWKLLLVSSHKAQTTAISHTTKWTTFIHFYIHSQTVKMQTFLCRIVLWVC